MSKYNKTNPFLATIKTRTLLSTKNPETFHLVLDLQGSHIHYKVGDALAIFPENHPSLVDGMASMFVQQKDRMIKPPRSDSSMSFKECLRYHLNLSRITISLIKWMTTQKHLLKKADFFETLLEEKNKITLAQFLAEYDLIDFLTSHTHLNMDVQDLISHLSPLLPRFYSIASSPYIYPNEAHLIVTALTYFDGKKQQKGVSSDFLCHRAQIGKTPIPIYLQPTPHFTLPQDSSLPLIMVGPGTGIAPFRAFLQERFHQKSSGKNWLIFGERHQKHHFYYKDFLLSLQKQNFLLLDLAFSRDQDHKIYVQHKLYKEGKRLWEWLEEGAHFYVCGDAKNMAKQVDATLHQILIEQGSLSSQHAKDYIKTLRRKRRYLMDVY